MKGAKDLLFKEVKVVNIGLETFSKNIQDSGARCIHLDWIPPAGGNTQLVNTLFNCELLRKEADSK